MAELDALQAEVDARKRLQAETATELSGKDAALPPRPPLRTGREGVPFIRLKPLQSSATAEQVNMNLTTQLRDDE